MNYGELVKDAFWISLRNRYLWFFGLFVGSTSLNLPNFGGNVPTGGSGPNGSGLSSALQTGGGPLDNVPLLVTLIAVGLLVALVLLFLIFVSQGALAESVAALDRGESRRFGSTFRAGLSNFWRVLGNSIVLLLIAVGCLLLIGVPVGLLSAGAFAATDSTGARIGFLILSVLLGLLLLIVVFVPLSIIGQYALRAVVVDRAGIFGSIRSGYRLFSRNLGRSLLLWLIRLALAIGVGIAFLLLALIVGLILFLPTIALGLAGYSTAAIATGAVAAVILIPLLLVASGAIGTFNHAYWTLAYLRLTSRNAVPDPQTVA